MIAEEIKKAETSADKSIKFVFEESKKVIDLVTSAVSRGDEIYFHDF